VIFVLIEVLNRSNLGILSDYSVAILRYIFDMSISNRKLPLGGNADLLHKLAGDFDILSKSKVTRVPQERVYILHCEPESWGISRSARKAAIKALDKNTGFVKLAFDTRRINQEAERNPRTNLQYWARSQQFIDEELQSRINLLAKVMGVLTGIKEAYGTAPEYFESYSRVLYDQIERVLRIKQGDQEIFRPQVAYLEQLLFARYRLSMDELAKIGEEELRRKILDKDENLLKRGVYEHQSGGPAVKTGVGALVIDGNSKTTPQNIVEAIFGNNDLRRTGEKKVQRTITITISDEVKD